MIRLPGPLAPLALSLLLNGCTGSEDDSAPIDTSPPPECLEDDACGANEICEQTECVLGDRDDQLEGAGPIFQVESLDDPGVRTGLIHAPGDIDHYVFNATEPGWVRVSTQTDGGDEGLDTVVSVFRADGALHHVMDEYATGSLRDYDSRMQVYLPTAGAWYIRVEDRSTYYGDDPQRGAPSFSYRLSVEGWSGVTAEPDSAEDPSVRFPIASGSIIYAWGVNLEEPGDIDWTSAELPWGDAPLEIWAPDDIPGSPLRPLVEVTDADGTVHLRKPDVGSEGFASTFVSEQDTYTVSVRDVDGGGSAEHWTVLYLRTRDEGTGNPREVEPNDTLADATPLDAETRTEGGVTTDRSFLQGKLLTEGDADHYRFSATAGGRLRVACSSDSYGALGDVDVDVIDPDGTTVATLTSGDDLAPDGEVEDLVEGAYTLRFYAADAVFGPGVYYRCGIYADRP